MLAHLIARELGTEAVRLIYHMGDAHLYSNHLEAAKEQLTRMPKGCRPYIEFDDSVEGLSTFTPDKVILKDYSYHPAIKAKVAV